MMLDVFFWLITINIIMFIQVLYIYIIYIHVRICTCEKQSIMGRNQYFKINNYYKAKNEKMDFDHNVSFLL